jgi:hypothetical protein
VVGVITLTGKPYGPNTTEVVVEISSNFAPLSMVLDGTTYNKINYYFRSIFIIFDVSVIKV